MPSMKSTVLAVAVALMATTSAQRQYFVEPDSVPKATRVAWCADQKSMCPAICNELEPGPPLVNECNSEELNYGCICANEAKPNVSEYTLTLPYHICQEWGNQCVEACGLGANACASSCREDNPCGALEPKKFNSSSSATMEPTPSSTDESQEIFTSPPGSENEEDDDSSASTKDIGRTMGLMVLLGGFVGGFALIL